MSEFQSNFPETKSSPIQKNNSNPIDYNSQHETIVQSNNKGFVSPEETQKLNQNMESELDKALLSPEAKEFLEKIQNQIQTYRKQFEEARQREMIYRQIRKLFLSASEKSNPNFHHLLGYGMSESEYKDIQNKILETQNPPQLWIDWVQQYEELSSLRTQMKNLKDYDEISTFSINFPSHNILFSTEFGYNNLSSQDIEIIREKVWKSFQDLAFEFRCRFRVMKVKQDETSYYMMPLFDKPKSTPGDYLYVRNLLDEGTTLPWDVDKDNITPPEFERTIKNIPEEMRPNSVIYVDDDRELRVLTKEEFQDPETELSKSDEYASIKRVPWRIPFIAEGVLPVALDEGVIGHRNDYGEIETQYHRGATQDLLFPLEFQNKDTNGLNISWGLGDDKMETQETTPQDKTLDEIVDQDIKSLLLIRNKKQASEYHIDNHVFNEFKCFIGLDLEKPLSDFEVGDTLDLGSDYKLAKLTLVQKDSSHLYFENEKQERIIFSLNNSQTIQIERPKPSGDPLDFVLNPEVFRDLIPFLYEERYSETEAEEIEFLKTIPGRHFTIQDYQYPNNILKEKIQIQERDSSEPLLEWQRKIILDLFVRYYESYSEYRYYFDTANNRLVMHNQQTFSQDYLSHIPSYFCAPGHTVFLQDDGQIDKSSTGHLSLEVQEEECTIPFEDFDGHIIHKDIKAYHITNTDGIIFSYQGLEGHSSYVEDKYVEDLYADSFYYYVRFDGETNYKRFPTRAPFSIQFLGRDPGYFAYINNDKIHFNIIPQKNAHEKVPFQGITLEEFDKEPPIPKSFPRSQWRLRNQMVGYCDPIRETEPIMNTIQVYPNPLNIHQTAHIEFQAEENTFAEISLQHIDGFKKTIPLSISKGVNSVDIPLNQEFPTGIYIIQVLKNGSPLSPNLKAGKMMIQK